MAPLADDGPRTCVWRSCSLRGERTTDERCPECGMPTEGVRGYVGGTLTYDATVLHRPLIVTTNDLPGYRITEVYGDVFGLVVMARDAFTNAIAVVMAVCCSIRSPQDRRAASHPPSTRPPPTTRSPPQPRSGRHRSLHERG